MVRETLLGVDFGTSHTVAVLHREGHGTPLLFDGSPLLPSAVFLDPDGSLLVGRDAERAAGAAPAHLEPNPKRRIDEHTVWLGEQEAAVPDLIAAVLRRVGDEARRVLGRPADRVVLTHPAGWGNQRLGVLTEAAARAGLGTPHLMGEPTAAAWYFITTLDRTVAPGRCVVVYDLGAGTFDVAVLRRSPEGFDVLAADGLDDLGGLDLDAAIVGHLRAQTPADAWGVLDWPRTPADRRARRHLWNEVRAAKEQLSRHPVATVHVPLVDADLPVTREEFEGLARPMLARTVAVTVTTLRAARIGQDAVAGVFLVGGSSRVPLAAVLLHRELGIAPTVIEQPELVVASGAGSPVREAAAPVRVDAEPDAPGPAPSGGPAAPAGAAPLVGPGLLTGRAGPAGSAARSAAVAPAARSAAVAPAARSAPVSPAARSAPVTPAARSAPVPARAAGSPPESPGPPRRSGLLIAGGVLAFAGAALVYLLPVALGVFDVVARDRSVGLGLSRGARPDVFLGDLLAPLAGFAVAVGAVVLGLRADARRWTAAGLLAGSGLFAVGPAVFYLSGLGEPGLRGLSRVPDRAGYLLLALGGVLAVAAMLRGRSGTGLSRPGRPAVSTVLIGLGVVTAVLYLGLRFAVGVPVTVVLFTTLWTAGVTVAAPVGAVLARPARLGAGLVAGAVLPLAVRVVVDLPFIYLQWGPFRTLAWAVHALLCLVMVAVAATALRGPATGLGRPAHGTSSAAAQAGKRHGNG